MFTSGKSSRQQNLSENLVSTVTISAPAAFFLLSRNFFFNWTQENVSQPDGANLLSLIQHQKFGDEQRIRFDFRNRGPKKKLICSQNMTIISTEFGLPYAYQYALDRQNSAIELLELKRGIGTCILISLRSDAQAKINFLVTCYMTLYLSIRPAVGAYEIF